MSQSTCAHCGAADVHGAFCSHCGAYLDWSGTGLAREVPPVAQPKPAPQPSMRQPTLGEPRRLPIRVVSSGERRPSPRSPDAPAQGALQARPTLVEPGERPSRETPTTRAGGTRVRDRTEGGCLICGRPVVESRMFCDCGARLGEVDPLPKGSANLRPPARPRRPREFRRAMVAAARGRRTSFDGPLDGWVTAKRSAVVVAVSALALGQVTPPAASARGWVSDQVRILFLGGDREVSLAGHTPSRGRPTAHRTRHRTRSTDNRIRPGRCAGKSHQKI